MADSKLSEEDPRQPKTNGSSAAPCASRTRMTGQPWRSSVIFGSLWCTKVLGADWYCWVKERRKLSFDVWLGKASPILPRSDKRHHNDNADVVLDFQKVTLCVGYRLTGSEGSRKVACRMRDSVSLKLSLLSGCLPTPGVTKTTTGYNTVSLHRTELAGILNIHTERENTKC